MCPENKEIHSNFDEFDEVAQAVTGLQHDLTHTLNIACKFGAAWVIFLHWKYAGYVLDEHSLILRRSKGCVRTHIECM